MIQIDAEASDRLNDAIKDGLKPFEGMPHTPDNLGAAQCEMDQIMQRIHIGEFGVFNHPCRLSVTYEHGYLEALLTLHF